MSTMLDKIEDTVSFDERGNLPRQENGERVPPAAPAENTAATNPSPDPAKEPADPVAETKTGDDKAPVAEPAPGTTIAKASTPDESKLTDDETSALKEKHSRPEDKGDEWQIRAARDGYKTRKQLEPVADVMERIGSPERARRGLELTAELADPEVPIANAWSRVTALSESRATELHDHLYSQTLDHFPDVVASDLVGEKASVAELKEGLKLLRSGKTAAQPQSATTITTIPFQQPSDVNPNDWELLSDDAKASALFKTVPKPDGMSNSDWIESLLDYPALAEAIQAHRAEIAKTKPTEKPAETELSPAEQQLKEIQEQRRQETIQRSWNDEIVPVYNELYSDAFAVVDNGLRDLGLVPDPAKDDEKTIKWKTRTAEAIREATILEFDGPNGPKGDDDWSLCSEQQKMNRGLVKKIHQAMLAKDFAVARDFQTHVKAQIDLAMQRAIDEPLELYNAAMLQSTTKTPRDGSGHTRPELVGGTAPGGVSVNKTPWLDAGYRKPNETHHDAMQRFMEENPNFNFRAA